MAIIRTITVRRANVILDVSEDEAERYLDEGYDILDEKGNVVERSIPRDIPSLQAQLQDARKEVDKLKEQVKELKERLKKATKPEEQVKKLEEQLKKATKPEEG